MMAVLRSQRQFARALVDPAANGGLIGNSKRAV